MKMELEWGKRERRKKREENVSWLHYQYLLAYWKGRFVLISIRELFMPILCTLSNYFQDDTLQCFYYCYSPVTLLYNSILHFP